MSGNLSGKLRRLTRLAASFTLQSGHDSGPAPHPGVMAQDSRGHGQAQGGVLPLVTGWQSQAPEVWMPVLGVAEQRRDQHGCNTFALRRSFRRTGPLSLDPPMILIEGWQPFSQVRPPLSLPGGCTYQVQSSTAPIRALTCLNTDKPEKASVDPGLERRTRAGRTKPEVGRSFLHPSELQDRVWEIQENEPPLCSHKQTRLPHCSERSDRRIEVNRGS